MQTVVLFISRKLECHPKANATIEFKVTLGLAPVPKVNAIVEFNVTFMHPFAPQSQRHRWVLSYHRTPSLPKVNATLTPLLSPKSTPPLSSQNKRIFDAMSPLGNLPELLSYLTLPQNYQILFCTQCKWHWTNIILYCFRNNWIFQHFLLYPSQSNLQLVWLLCVLIVCLVCPSVCCILLKILRSDIVHW